jgi:uncharacterized membrane protein SpoIIM required for sporulation
MRAIGVVVIVSGFVIFWAFIVFYWVGYQTKRLASKKGRSEIKTEFTDFSNFVVKDKDFHKAAHEEFRGFYIVVGLVVIALLASALGLG